MSQDTFYVSHEGQSFGPFSSGEIIERVKLQELHLSDYVYDVASKDWVMIISHAHFAGKLDNVKPNPSMRAIKDVPAGMPEASGEVSQKAEWYVLKGDLRFGPFAQAEVVRLMQEKSVSSTDFVWAAPMAQWKKIEAVESFSQDAVKALKDSGFPAMNEVFFRRRHQRVAYGTSLIVHNNKKTFKGKSMEIAEGGAGLLLDTADLETGHSLFLHFKPAAELPAFHARCEIVSKRAINSSDKSAPYHYGVKFVDIQTTTVQQIQDLALKRAG